jgi:hypothetical protein
MQSSAPAPPGHSPHGTLRWAIERVIEDSISQCPFLQMTYTAENPHAGGSAAPGARPRYQPPRHRDLHATFRTHDNGMAARQTSCRQQTAPPQPRCRPPMPGPRCSGQPPSGRSGFSSPLRNRIFFTSLVLGPLNSLLWYLPQGISTCDW